MIWRLLEWMMKIKRMNDEKIEIMRMILMMKEIEIGYINDCMMKNIYLKWWIWMIKNRNYEYNDENME